MRFGLDGTLVHPKSYEALPLRADLLATLRELEPHAEATGASAALDHLYRATHAGTDASYLQQEYEERGSAEGMVAAAITRFRTDSA